MPKRLTAEQVVEQFQAVHGPDRYDYSKVEWVNAKTKVCIICPEHGEFLQRPDSHRFGNGCPKCGAIKKTPEGVIADFATVHGPARYDYSKVEYVGAHTKICIICPEHGEFMQTPDSHRSGNGCPKCGRSKSADARRSSFENVIAEFTAIHGVGIYDYSKVKYVNSATKVCIVCPEHGEFLQTPSKHSSGQGCPKCGGSFPLTTADAIAQFESVHGVGRYDYSEAEYVNAHIKIRIICPEHGEFLQKPDNHWHGQGCPKCIGRGLSREEVIAGFVATHGAGRYDYSEVEFVTGDTKVCIVCPEHGEFLQTPYEHKRGAGCPKCAGFKLTTDEAIADFEAVHGTETYDYSKVEYLNTRTKICIVCPEHGDFWQKPNNHKNGQGCPFCGEGGFDLTVPATLYYLRVETRNQTFWKVGITNRTVEERFSPSDFELITILSEKRYESGADALMRERAILKHYETHRYEGPGILSSGGNTELFTSDVLGLDKRRVS